MKCFLVFCAFLAFWACKARTSKLTNAAYYIESARGVQAEFLCNLGEPLAFGIIQNRSFAKHTEIYTLVPLAEDIPASDGEPLFAVKPQLKRCDFGAAQGGRGRHPYLAAKTTMDHDGLTTGDNKKPLLKTSRVFVPDWVQKNTDASAGYHGRYRVAAYDDGHGGNLALWDKNQVLWKTKKIVATAPIKEVGFGGSTMLVSTQNPPVLYSLDENAYKKMPGPGPHALEQFATVVTRQITRDQKPLANYENFISSRYSYVFLSNKNYLMYEDVGQLTSKTKRNDYLRSFSEVRAYVQDAEHFYVLQQPSAKESDKIKSICSPNVVEGDVISAIDHVQHAAGEMTLNIFAVGYRPEAGSKTVMRLLWQHPYVKNGVRPGRLKSFPTDNPILCLEEFNQRNTKQYFGGVTGVSRVRFAPVRRAGQSGELASLRFASVAELPVRMAAGIEAHDLQIHIMHKSFTHLSQHMNTSWWRGPHITDTLTMDTLTIRNVGLDKRDDIEIWWGSFYHLYIKLPDHSIYVWDSRGLLGSESKVP